MILVFGGTTEGRKAVEVLEEGGGCFFYSTKTGEQDIVLHHGIRLDGAMNADAMLAFCREHDVRLIVDAAHPFASKLHETIVRTAAEAAVPVVRYERIYPPRDPDITWIDDYSQVPTDLRTLLATTGVQSIGQLKYLEEKGIKVYYRILPRESSIRLAHAQGAADDRLCFYESGHDIDVQADAVLLKESGESGGFSEKVAAARQRGMRIIAVKRPPFPSVWKEETVEVNGPYGLRRAVEKLLPEFFPLKSGLTTGTCATAAAVAATLQLMHRLSEALPSEVPVILPDGETIRVPVRYETLRGCASCIKEAGDDPDVTDGIEIRASVALSDSQSSQVEILGGEGIGRFTLPGFDYPPGEPAINKVPRQMIRQNVLAVLSSLHPHPSTLTPPPLTVTLSVPNGAEVARRTFNPRLGIEGGISIIGVSGIVKPFSEEAFIQSIRKCMQVAVASGSERVVINSGGKSERFVKALYPDLPQQAFVEYGNYVGETLKIARELGVRQLTLGLMLGKAVKLAEGQLDTHSRRATMNRDFIRQMLVEAHIDLDLSAMTLARELWTLIPSARLQSFVNVVITHCQRHCQPLLPDGELTILLISDEGQVFVESKIE